MFLWKNLEKLGVLKTEGSSFYSEANKKLKEQNEIVEKVFDKIPVDASKSMDDKLILRNL